MGVIIHIKAIKIKKITNSKLIIKYKGWGVIIKFKIDEKNFNLYYILKQIYFVKNNFLNLKYLQGFAPHPSSFIGIKEPKELHF